MAGSITERGNNKFMVRLYIGRENGKRKYHSKMITGTKKDAQAYLNKILHKKDQGTVTYNGRITVEQQFDNWLKWVKGSVSERTFSDYESRVNLYLLDDEKGIGNIRLDRLKPERIDSLYNDMLERGLSARTIRYTHFILKNCLKLAVDREQIYKNPADSVNLPKKKAVVKPKTLTPEQVAIFMDEARFSKWQAFYSLMLDSGMRPSEALALKWDDVDFQNNRVTVKRTLHRHEGGGWSLDDETKTDKSRRSIILTKTTMKDLREHKNDQNEHILQTPGYNKQNFVFACENGQPGDGRNILRRDFKPLLKRAGLPDMRLYDLRHTCATLLLFAGENPKKVSERLGHASITLTLDTYTHAIPDMQQSCADKLEELLNRHTKTAHQKKTSEV